MQPHVDICARKQCNHRPLGLQFSGQQRPDAHRRRPFDHLTLLGIAMPDPRRDLRLGEQNDLIDEIAHHREGDLVPEANAAPEGVGE